MDIRLIEMFNAALVEGNEFSFCEMNAEAMKRGYLVHPDVCNKSVMNYILSQDFNPNATFYKDWEDVLEKSRFELFIDQILHYVSTYGTDYNGVPYISNDGAENVPERRFDYFKVILPISEEDLFNKCMDLLTCGIAMKNESLDAICGFVIESGFYVDVDSIKNREAMIRICDAKNIFPTQSISLFRYIVYRTIGDAMIIKNQDTINKIKYSINPFDFNLLNDNQLISLSKVFYRFKPLFLAFKKFKHNAPIINKIRKLAKYNHVPMQTPFWNNVMSVEHSNDELKEHLDELTNFKKISIMESIMLELSEPNNKLYIIRNGRTFLKKNDKLNDHDGYLVELFDILRNSVIDSLKNKATYCKFPKYFNLVCPTSEKNFIGNYPIGSNYEMSEHNFIGVYWRGEWGTHDFDLHCETINHENIGWCYDYKSGGGNIVYSGDMTIANPDASEVMLCKGKDFPNSIFNVNRFDGVAGSKFKLFFGVKHGYVGFDNKHHGYMVDPNDIQLSVDMISTDRQTTLGVVKDNKFYLTDLKTGKTRVTPSGKGGAVLETMLNKFDYLIPLKEILLEAGFKDYDENHYEDVVGENGLHTIKEIPWDDDKYIDFNNLSKDTLIKLFA